MTIMQGYMAQDGAARNHSPVSEASLRRTLAALSRHSLFLDRIGCQAKRDDTRKENDIGVAFDKHDGGRQEK